MLATTVALLDISDVEGFVNGTINRARLSLKPDERDELVAEGLAILYRLADVYEPHREGHARNDSRFSGFAAQFLPRKLGDAWHRMHPEHRLVTDQETGKRRWVYHDKACSYDRVIGEPGNRPGGAGHAGPRVRETNVRHVGQFLPLTVPTRTRPDHASPTADRAPHAA